MTRWPVPHTGWAKLGWKGRGGPMSRVQPYGLCTPLAPPTNTQAPLLASKGRERQWRQPAPLCWAPCWTLERGKRRGRERPTQTHTKSPVYVYAEFDRECTFSSTDRARRKPTGQNRTDNRHVGEVGAKALSSQVKLYNLHKILSLFQEILLLKT